MPIPFIPVSLKMTIRERLLKRLNAMDAEGPAAWTWNGDGVATMHNTDFLREQAFEQAYQKGWATKSWGRGQPRFRVYTACWAALQTRDLPGDYVECGVNRGGMARAQIELLDFNRLDKSYWLVDTFRGFPEAQKPLVSEGMSTDNYGECYQDVVQTFAPFPRVRLVQEAVPAALPQVKADAICYLSLDMNTAEPELQALEYFWPRLSRGAIVLMDDYAYRGYSRQKIALDEFAVRQNIHILGLATGQGLIVKN